ncbi:hypothetical protein MOBT1_001119 [Malassezia obtusa]|uniref:ATP synthase subunit H, mitochondrial n=1 Tax=Malassezia obtusa TaxID=76774 RepID=A0AAF0IVV5_9BASI|nr:hypothetical protein MOBT1_001119 [Malassezia obtusa]
MLAIAQRSLMAARVAGVRALSTTTVARKDLVQDLYLKTLKSFEAPKQSPDAHKGVVREFSQPQAPKEPPSVVGAEIDKALDDFKAYDPDEVPVAARGEESVAETQDVNRYLEELQKDVHVQKEHH